MSTRIHLVGTALAWLFAMGCASGPGGIDSKALPATPVAILYREEALALKRLDAIRDLGKRSKPSDREGMVVRVETLDAFKSAVVEAKQASRNGKPYIINAIIGKTDFRKGSVSM